MQQLTGNFINIFLITYESSNKVQEYQKNRSLTITDCFQDVGQIGLNK